MVLEKSGGRDYSQGLELALLDGRADLAVHSAKDMPRLPAVWTSLLFFLGKIRLIF